MGRRAQGWRLVSGRRPQEPLYVRFRHADKRHYLSTGERDPRRATLRAKAIYAAVVSGRWGQATRLSPAAPIDELVSEYLANIEATGTNERFSMQRVHFRAHLLSFFPSLDEVGSEAAWADFEAHRRRCGVSARTVAKELSTLRSFAKWCRQRRLLESVPEYKAPRAQSDYVPLTLEPEQVEAILAALPEYSSRGNVVRARYVFAWETGLRPSTISRLLVSDYNRNTKTLHVRCSADKARFDRYLPLTERAWHVIESIAPSTGLVFGPRRPHDELKLAARAAGLSEDVAVRVASYMFRHSRVTQLSSASTDVRGIAYLAGHKNVATTSLYIHGNLRAAARVLEAVSAQSERTIAKVLGE